MNNVLGWVWVIASILLNVGASVLLKLSSRVSLLEILGLSNLKATFFMVAALILYGGAFAAYFLALRWFALGSTYSVITAGTATIIWFISIIFLKEEITSAQIIGAMIAIVGIVLITTTAPSNIH